MEYAFKRDGLLDKFFQKKSLATQRSYTRDLCDFATFVGEDDPEKAVAQFLLKEKEEAEETFKSWIFFLQNQGLRERTINRKISTFRSLSTLARRIGYIEWTLDVPFLDVQKKEEKDQVKLSLDQFLEQEGITTKEKRDKAIFALMFHFGFYPKDVVRFNYPKDYKEIERRLLEVDARNRHYLQRDLQNWIEVRGKKKGPLFFNMDRAGKGRRLSSRSVDRNIIKEIGFKLGSFNLRSSTLHLFV